MGEGIVDANPVIGTNKPAEAARRERVLADAELIAVWRACGEDDYGRIVKLLILTGCRREEIGGLQWSEIDAGARAIRLPAERCKNHRAHELPLSELAWRTLREAPRLSGEQVFGRSGFVSWSRAKHALDGQLGNAVAPWRLHDIRRTVATRMADIGIMPHVIEAILNHQSGHKRGPAGVYNHSRYVNEVRSALARWARHIEQLLIGRKLDTVVKLHKRH
jgi:integrase